MGDVDVLAAFKATAAEVQERDLPEITRETRLTDLGLDSVAMMEILGCLEDDLDVVLPEDRIAGLETVGDIERLVLDQLR